MRYKCLVLDHDDTVVQSMKTLSYPFFLYVLEQLRPGATISLEDYILGCHRMGFVDLCREVFGFTQAEADWEHKQWMDYIRTHTPDAYPGIGAVIRQQKAQGGLVCVVSHSSRENILRDYRDHFGLEPDAIYGMDLPKHQRKPSPWPLEDILERFHLTPEELLVVDDMQLACAMAQPLGVAVGYAGWSGLGVEEISREMEALCAFRFPSTEALFQFLFQEEC